MLTFPTSGVFAQRLQEVSYSWNDWCQPGDALEALDGCAGPAAFPFQNVVELQVMHLDDYGSFSPELTRLLGAGIATGCRPRSAASFWKAATSVFCRSFHRAMASSVCFFKSSKRWRAAS